MPVRIGYTLAMAAATGAPVRVAGQLTGQLAVAAQDDLAGQFTRKVTAAAAGSLLTALRRHGPSLVKQADLASYPSGPCSGAH